MGAEYDDLIRLRDRLDDTAKRNAVNDFMVDTMNTISSAVLTQTKRNTPWKSGTLRRGWKVSSPTLIGNSYTAIITNDVKYASYVETGHRTRARTDGSRGWVEGKFMLTRAEDLVKRNSQQFIQNKLDRFIGGLFDDTSSH